MAQSGRPPMPAPMSAFRSKADNMYESGAYPTAAALLPALRLSHQGQMPGASS
jgi:hypothetical protein